MASSVPGKPGSRKTTDKESRLGQAIDFSLPGKQYFEELKKRSKTSRVYKSYQLTGLEIANILEDWRHKSLYIKLAKEHGYRLLEIAKSVAERKNVKNRGAYFMSLIVKPDKNKL